MKYKLSREYLEHALSDRFVNPVDIEWSEDGVSFEAESCVDGVSRHDLVRENGALREELSRANHLAGVLHDLVLEALIEKREM